MVFAVNRKSLIIHTIVEELNDEKFKRSMKLKAFVVYDPKKAVGDINSVMDAVTGTELKLEGTKPHDPERVYDDLSAFIRRFVTYNVDSEVL